MLRHVLFDMALFDGERDRPSSQKRILALLQALTYCNQLYLREHPETPFIYQSGITYKLPEQFEQAQLPEVATLRQWLLKKQPPQDVWQAFMSMADQLGSGEHFRDIPRILENGGGDCDNVSAWRAAELRELNIFARPYITWRKRPDGGTTYHVIVMWPDGSSEDPSLLLGMGGADRARDRAEEERKNQERMAKFSAALSVTRNTDAAAETVFGGGALPSDFGKGLQYTPAFQSDDSYEDWSPTRPQGFYANPLYPNLPSTPGGGPLFNTRLRDPDDDFEDRMDRFDGLLPSQRRKLVRSVLRRRRRTG